MAHLLTISRTLQKSPVLYPQYPHVIHYDTERKDTQKWQKYLVFLVLYRTMQRRPDGETDITSVFGTDGPGSIPGRGTGKINMRHAIMSHSAGMVQW